ncbi:MAG: hypothetical protein ACSLE5_03640 [Porticoccaceae bacterium]
MFEFGIKVIVCSLKEEGTNATPFDMVAKYGLDRFHLIADVIDRLPGRTNRAAYVKQVFRNKLLEHRKYIGVHGEDLPEI